MPQEIVFYHSAMQGAPSSTLNAAGALVAVLDGCLVNGFNVNTISTLTRSGTVATATTSGTNGYSIGEWVEVSGAVETAYNGRVKVTGKPAVNQFTYTVAGSPATPATGTVTSKYPGAGWLKTAAGTNNAAYQSGAGSLGLWMQVEDNNPYADSNVGARTRMAQGWTALDSATVLGNQNNIHKLTGGWLLVADHKTCYLYMGGIGAATATTTFAFGEIASFYSGDSFSFFQNRGRTSTSANLLITPTTTVSGQFGGSHFPYVAPATGVDAAAGYQVAEILRGTQQIGAPVPVVPIYVNTRGLGSASSVNYVSPGQTGTSPNLPDNSIQVGPVFAFELSTSQNLRGRFRGVHMPVGRLPSGFSNSYQRLDDALIDGVTQSLLVVNTNNYDGVQVAFQIDGAWS